MSVANEVSVPPTTGRGEAVGLAIVAGCLLLIEGVYILEVAALVLPFASVPPLVAGVLSLAGGLALLILAYAYRVEPEARPYIGPTVVIISAGGIWFGGGFLVGTILGLVAGVLMIVLPVYWD